MIPLLRAAEARWAAMVSPPRDEDATARPLALAERLWVGQAPAKNKTHPVLWQSSVAPTTDEAR